MLVLFMLAAGGMKGTQAPMSKGMRMESAVVMMTVVIAMAMPIVMPMMALAVAVAMAVAVIVISLLMLPCRHRRSPATPGLWRCMK